MTATKNPNLSVSVLRSALSSNDRAWEPASLVTIQWEQVAIAA